MQSFFADPNVMEADGSCKYFWDNQSKGAKADAADPTSW
jgi:hypothetical protein